MNLVKTGLSKKLASSATATKFSDGKGRAAVYAYQLLDFDNDVGLKRSWCAVDFVRSKMAARETGAELMRERTLYPMYTQQLSLFRDRKLQHNLATWCSRPADLLWQRAALDKLAGARVVKLGISVACGLLGLLLTR